MKWLVLREVQNYHCIWPEGLKKKDDYYLFIQWVKIWNPEFWRIKQHRWPQDDLWWHGPNAVFFKISMLYDTNLRVTMKRWILFAKPNVDEIAHRILYSGDRAFRYNSNKPAYRTVTYTVWHIPDVVLIKLTLLMMSTGLLETCRESEWICVKGIVRPVGCFLE